MRRGQRADALAHLEAATALFEQYGAKLYLDQVHERREELRGARRRGAPAYPDGLSEREIEVLRLMAAGRRNREIAEQLVIAEGTVANHVRNILTKTNTANRAEASAYAVQRGLTEP